MKQLFEDKMLVWSQSDIEKRFGFKGGRNTSVNTIFTLILALLFTGIFYAVLVYGLDQVKTPIVSSIVLMFERSGNLSTVIPATVLFFWCAAILLVKRSKVNFQREALNLAAIPQEPEFLLTVPTAKVVLDRIHLIVDNPRHFILLNRIEKSLANMKNMGQVNDVASVLKSQADNDEDQVQSSFHILTGMIWAIPVLGFIGTVLGLSQAIGQFTSVLQSADDVAQIKQSLQGVTGGLSTAFETTLVALVFALIVQLWTTWQQAQEMEFLDECNDYCQQNMISKLRIVSGNENDAETALTDSGPSDNSGL